MTANSIFQNVSTFGQKFDIIKCNFKNKFMA